MTRSCFYLLPFTFLLTAACQQKMAEQPAPRPYEVHTGSEHNQSARTLRPGVIHRNQAVGTDPLITWLTPEGRKVKAEVKPSGDASFDPKSVVPQIGAPNKVENFVKEFPFKMQQTDLERGQELFNINCALCHGAAGFGNGKIVERGYLKPPSYHTDPTGKTFDSGHLNVQDKVDAKGKGIGDPLPVGYSRGFDRWGVRVALDEVPVGYIFQVITLGFAGMPAHNVQLADPADRWRVIAYIRALQYSQQAPESAVPEKNRADLSKVGGEPK